MIKKISHDLSGSIQKIVIQIWIVITKFFCQHNAPIICLGRDTKAILIVNIYTYDIICIWIYLTGVERDSH